MQGFHWDQLEYSITEPETGEKFNIRVELDQVTYTILLRRYNELFETDGQEPPVGDDGESEAPFDIPGFPFEMSTGKIDHDYMNARFEKFRKILSQGGAAAENLERAATELHKSFATLTQEEQKYANIFLNDIQRGDVIPKEGKTFRDYLTEYMARAHDDRIHRFAEALGLSEQLLRDLMGSNVTASNINEFGRLDELKKTVDLKKAAAFFSKGGPTLPPLLVKARLDGELRRFILSGGFDVPAQG